MEEPVPGFLERIVGRIQFGGAGIGIGPLGLRAAMEAIGMRGRGQFQEAGLQGVGVEPGATRFLEQGKTIGHDQASR